MADERRYRANGGAAVDLYATQSAVRVPQQRPNAQPVPRPHKKPKLEIAPVAIVGALVVIVLLALVLEAQVRLFRLKRDESALQAQVTQLDQELSTLRSDYEGKVNLRSIETEARALGMRKPTASQTVYLSIAGADSAEVLHTEEKGFLGTLWDAVSDSFTGILEYFR